MTLLVFGSLLAGLLAGVIAGLLGVGGGLILVPALLFLFHLDGINPLMAMPMAVGTSLATIIVTNSVATWGHHQRGAVNWPLVRQYAPAILLGSWLGSHVAVVLDGQVLRMAFGGFEMAVGLKMVWPATPLSLPLRTTLADWGHALAGLIIGGLSSLFGIGGGTLSVPVLHGLAAVPMHHAVGTSSAIGIFISLAGTLGFVHAGWNQAAMPSASAGFVLSPAFLGIVAGTIVTTPLGVKLAHSLDANRLKQWFGLILLLVGSKLLIL